MYPSEEIIKEYEADKNMALQFYGLSHPVSRCPNRHMNICDSVLGYLAKHGKLSRRQMDSFGVHRIAVKEFVAAQYRADVRHVCR